MLRVGPESAGARPGPICYGRGSTEPTITDANLVLGRLDPDALLSVDAPVTRSDIEQAIRSKIADPLGLELEGAAAAILRIANDKMAGAVRMVSLARGHDPRDFALFAFGGAGPLHATALAAELGIPKVVIPARPGITNAIGCVVADLRHDFVNTVNTPLPDLDMDAVHALLAEQETEGRRLIAEEAVDIDRIDILRSVDMQFLGQSHILSVPINTATPSRETLADLFQAAYWDRFAVDLPEIRPVLVNLHSAVLGRRPRIEIEAFAGSPQEAGTIKNAIETKRPVWFDGTGTVETPVFRRDALPKRATFKVLPSSRSSTRPP